MSGHVSKEMPGASKRNVTGQKSPRETGEGEAQKHIRSFGSSCAEQSLWPWNLKIYDLLWQELYQALET